MAKKNYNQNEISEKSWLVCMLLLWFCPVHRFYVGKIGTGILFSITGGGLGIWWIVDLVKILNYTFKDKSGKYVWKNGSKVPSTVSGEDRLLKLHELYEKKIISKEEYEARKQKLLKESI